MTATLCLTLFAPLAGAVILALAGRALPRMASGPLACLAVAASLAGAVASWAQLDHGRELVVHLFTWFEAGGLRVSATLLYNPLCAVMTTMVAFVSLVIHVHSLFFMRDDDGWVRYFCYLNLFVFFMQSIAMADDLVFLFMGWEGVGFCSFSLIGFWYAEPKNVLAGNKAFLVTRIGDVAFLGALAVLFASTGDLSIHHLSSSAPIMAAGTLTLVGLLLLTAATGKSAQLPLLVWLPDAMAGPSPVSALIHAATMVTAGVYLLIRTFPVLLNADAAALQAVAVVGALTAFVAACSALAQHDIKRVLAWSTISQVGYMFLGVGAGDPSGSFFHLLVHAFFKSLLFMVAGIVIQALDEEHDIFRMGARVRKIVPGAALAFFCGAAALAGLPPFAGFFSKGRILENALNMAQTGQGIWVFVWAAGTVTALLTAIYSFRVFLLAFTGRPSLPPETGTEKTPGAMLHVLWPLALLAVVAGLLDLPAHFAHLVGAPALWLDRLTGLIPAARHGAEWTGTLAEGLDAGLAVLGLLVALALYGPWRERRAPAQDKGMPRFLLNGWGLDALYMNTVARPYVRAASKVWRNVEDRLVDGAALGLGALALRAGGRLSKWGAERLSNYLLWLLLGVVAMLVVMAAIGIR
ncbi:NADH-quinone oxidoreductase subunit L [Pseudodesulfovibrio hydrargyri]|uniref:NADH-quinone oxidoreductase subunit L n=1 Tax=Pseudodesulfovibrio hydrargyri TaxID=2125990 RepID=A0A1J5MT02_9BACT|nr:NADH-quinone oxidoreductase subunit L [Pseudodesulfovibrio hydrargyri]OIQ49130.1 NADH-quinone oxidoreductase subunit L [Pseudodesulfovibrio hydrargyri]